MKKIFLFIFIISNYTLLSQNFEVSTDKNPALTEEIIKLIFTVNAKGKDFTPPNLINFHIINGPSQGFTQSYSNINGKTRREIKTTISYSLQAKSSGKFTISAASINVDGVKLKTKEFILDVQRNNNNKKNNESKNNIFVRQLINKNERSTNIIDFKNLYKRGSKYSEL